MKTLTILGWRFTIERRARVRMCLDAQQQYRFINDIGDSLVRRECLLVRGHESAHAYGEWQRL